MISSYTDDDIENALNCVSDDFVQPNIILDNFDIYSDTSLKGFDLLMCLPEALSPEANCPTLSEFLTDPDLLAGMN